MADNPFSPEGNPFLQGDGGPTGGGPTADGGGGVTQGPAAVPETTKPRQMPGGASPTGLPVGAPMGGGDPGGSGPAPMPFTNPAVSGQGQNMPTGTNTPQPTPPTQAQAFRRAVAIRDEIIAANPHLTDEQAFFLAKQAVALQVTARNFDPKDFNDPKNPASPNHPSYWRNRNQGGAPQWNPQGPTLGPQSGYGESDPTWAQKARQMGYSGQSPALVGMVPSLWSDWKRYRQRRNLQKGEQGQQEHAPEQATEPEGQHTPEPQRAPRKPGEPGRHQAPEQTHVEPQGDLSRGKHVLRENSEPQPNQNAATGPIPGEQHTQPGGPPTPHPHPNAPQPGEHSVPHQRPSAQVPPRPPRTTPKWQQDPSKANQDVLPYGNGRGRHRRAMVYTAAQVYGEA